MTKNKFSTPKSQRKPRGHGLSSYMSKARAKDFVVCSDCGINEIGMHSKVFSYSSERWGKPVCWSCQKRQNKKFMEEKKAEAQNNN